MNDDLTFDFGRRDRIGMPEIVYGEFKSSEQLQRIVAACIEKDHDVLISRCDAEKAESLNGGAYDPVARTWTLQKTPAPQLPGSIGIVSAGTADAPVVNEAANTLAFLGISNSNYQDVGVAGIHRLMNRLEEISTHDVIICVAGFEGALASVLAGQLACPVIGVPTSVGYGVAKDGQAALHAMLSSCANGLMVMNVDNGVGAALAARRMLNLKKD